MRARLAGVSPTFNRRSLAQICLRPLPLNVMLSGIDMAFYIDTSALVKLVVAEAETPALLAWLKTSGCDLLSCDLARTELLRAVRRAAPGRAVQAHAVLETLTLLEVTGATFEEAGRLGPSTLRTSDSLHLAAALDLGDDLEGLVTYADGLAEAAELNGVLVVSPA